jgi:uncharacterized protein YbjT (DUF2867 family)
VELTLGEPAGLVPDMGGPRVYGMAELLRGYLRASHRRRRLIVPLWLPGEAARVFRAGANLAPEQAVGRQTWEEFLADQVRGPARHDGDAVGAPEDAGTAVSANPGSNVTATPR